jgi:hypothetical protein
LNIRINIDRATLFHYLRLVLFAIIIIYYFRPIADMFDTFNKAVIPLAKNCFHFVRPVGVRGESDVCDFTTFYASGLLNRERLAKHRDIDVYDPILLTQTVERIAAPMRPTEVFSIQYAPILFALTTPLAYYDLHAAWQIWSFASAVCIIIIFVCIAYSALKTRPWLLTGLFVCFANAAVAQHFIVGQTTAFEAAIIAISLRLLINRSFFWAGLVAGMSFFKLQLSPIILIPGISLGRSKFFYGCILMTILEAFLSTYLVGYNNVLNFLKINYLSEITHAYVGLNETFSMSNFRALLLSLPGTIHYANTIATLTYILSIIASVWIWIKIYPSLQKISGYAFELVASLSTIALFYFSLHAYLYDYLLLIIPGLWLYIWNTSADSHYTTRQSLIRFFIALVIFMLPFLLWTNIDLTRNEANGMWCELRLFFCIIIFLFCAIMALAIEFKQNNLKTVVSKL